jgi:PAS domain S-box-containing protein
MLRTIASCAALLALALAAALLRGSEPRPIAVVPWFVPLTNGFVVLIALCVSILALGRWRVLRDPVSFWVGAAFSAYGIGQVFTILTFPGVVPGGEPVIGHLRNNAAWIGTVSLQLLGLSLLAAALLRWPREASLQGWRSEATVAGWLVGNVLLNVLFVALEEHMPVMVDAAGGFTLLVPAISGVVLGVECAAAAGLAIRRHLREGDTLLAWISLCLIAYVGVAILFVVEERRFDFLWFVQRGISVAGFLIVLLGLLSEHVELVRREREKTVRLLESEQRLRRSNEIARVGSWELDRETNRLLWSEEVYRLFGVEPGAFEGTYQAFLDAVHPDDRAAVDAAYSASLHDGRDGCEIEHRVIHGRSGELRFIQERCEHRRDASGRIVRSVGMAQDVTERRAGELRVRELNDSLERRNAELEAERMRWQGVVEGIADEVWICDAAGRMSLINLPVVTAMGLDAFTDKSVGEVHEEVDILHPDGRPRPPEEAPLLRSLRTGEVVRGEEIMRHRATGKVRWRQFSCAPTRDATGAITGAVAIVRDVTENRRTEQALRDADHRKNEFLAMLGHELRNPLAPIRSSLYILARSAPGGEQSRRARATIERQVNHLTRLVGDLLDVSRITRGKIQIQRERLDLGELVSRTAEDYRPVFAEREVAFTVEGADGPLWIDGDEARLAQVLGNVLQNAVKFTPAGGAVVVRLGDDGRFAVVAVRDTGDGIPPEILPRLFEPFTQADHTLDRSSGGLGLGLSLLKGIVDLHGGDVRARSDGPGRGAEITFRVPLAAGAPRAPEPTLDGPRPAARRVLVIEDNVDAAETLREVLELDHHVVEVAHSGPDGLAKARAFAPDVVLCDIGLPGMSGYEVARAFRADASLRGVWLVAVTGYAGIQDEERAVSAGFDRHVSKPLEPDAIGRLLADPTAGPVG